MSISAIGRRPSPISINGLFFDDQTLRIEFGITRMDDVKPNTQMTGRRYPAVRLVCPQLRSI
jgi:hypothetical protein